MSVAVGTHLGPYHLTSLLGAGGMGEVYRATDPRLGRDVAIKVLPAGFSADPERLSRFEREARAAAALNHPNILVVYDIGTHDGIPYVVSELLEGQSLRETLAAMPVPPRKAIDYAIQIAGGLGMAHSKGIVHRDLKPENVFVTPDGRIKILDFGLAKLTLPGSGVALETELTSAAPTRLGVILGTVGYMAPEQVRGALVDERADVFALGLVLYEMITGRRAFQGESAADTMSAVLHGEPAEFHAPAGTSPALARVIRRCLEKQPQDRFQSARDVRFALETLSDLDAVHAAPAHSEKSIAVLPFLNMSPEQDNDYFSDGLSDDLISALARLPGLRVAARTSAFRFRGRDTDIREIGRQLNVQSVLEGSVRRSGKRLRVTAQLVNVTDGYHLWSERYDREVEDVFAIQDEITSAIVSTLEPTLLGGTTPAAKRHTNNLQAYELYLKGRQLWHQRTPRSLRAASEQFAEAARIDPTYALAHAGLADSYVMLTLYGVLRTSDGRVKAEAATKRAMAIDPQLAESQFAMALLKYFLTEDWAQAEPHFREALAIDPRSPLTHAYYASFLATQFRVEEARARVMEAVALDGLSPVPHAHAALTLYICREYEEALRCGERAAELDGEFVLAQSIIGLSCVRLGRHARAIEVLERLVALSDRAPIFVSLAGLANAVAGRRAEAFLLLDELLGRGAHEYISAAEPMRVWVGLGHHDQIHAALEACLVEGTIGPRIENFVGPYLDALAEQPRFSDLFSRLRLYPRPGA